jgi:hypothetical protein
MLLDRMFGSHLRTTSRRSRPEIEASNDIHEQTREIMTRRLWELPCMTQDSAENEMVFYSRPFLQNVFHYYSWGRIIDERVSVVFIQNLGAVFISQKPLIKAIN